MPKLRLSLVLILLLLLASSMAFAQSSSPEALYDRGVDAITGIGPSENDALGADCFKRSADLGYGPAQIALAYFYETGIVVQVNQEQAVSLYRKAAQQGDPLAAWMLGRHYLLGNGVARDLDAARKWFKMSADQNNAYGAYYLGRLLFDSDAAKTSKVFKLAAEQGLPQAQYYYALTLKNGSGVPQDNLESYVWFSIAADAGYSQATSGMGELERLLSIDQVSLAKAKARDMEQVVVRAINAKGCSGWEGEFDEYPTPPPVKLQRFCH
jgi:uncharacterized protein